MRRISIFHVLLAVLAIVLLSYAASSFAATQSLANVKSEVGISGQVITNPTTATFLTVPAGAMHAWITITGGDACWSSDAGAAPTGIGPGRWLSGSERIIPNDPLFLKRIRLINCTDQTAVINVYYTRERRFNDAQP